MLRTRFRMLGTMRRSIGVGLVAVMLSAFCASQSKAADWPSMMLYKLDGDTAIDQLGWSVANAGDIGYDGTIDFVAGAPSGVNPYDPPGSPPFGPGFARVYDGVSGAVLYEKHGIANGDLFGWSVAGDGDLDSDDPEFYKDFVVGAPGSAANTLDSSGSVYVYSGRTGSLVYQKDGTAAHDMFGWSVVIAGPGWSGPGGDNRLVVGAPDADTLALTDNGAVYVYQGSDPNGTFLYKLIGGNSGDQFGYSVGNVGYGSGGQSMFIVGAPLADPSGMPQAGAAYVYNTSGGQLYQIDGDTAGDYFGWSVSSAGDINLDGRADFMVGAPNAAPGGLTNAGAVYVYSGDNASLLFRIDGIRAHARIGMSVAAAGDVNGDGWPDVMAGSQVSSGPASPAVIYSGRDGSPLVYLSRNSVSPLAVAGGLNVNNDGRADFVIGDSYTCGPCPMGGEMYYEQAGTVYLFQSGYDERIESITDVGNDQGGQVRVQWKSLPGNNNFVKQFAIYRRVDGAKRTSLARDPFHLEGTPPGTWDFVQSVPARADTLYSAVVPTLEDSTQSGTVWSMFFVSGIGDNPVDHFDSPVDSGYSIDNLAPAPPPSLIAAPAGSDITLDWGTAAEADFDFFWVYRDIAPGFIPDISKRIASTSDTAFLDTSVPPQQPYYVVTAVDFSGNESDPSNEATVVACSCPYQGDMNGDGFIDSVDLSLEIDIVFFGATDPQDPQCPETRADMNCDGFADSVDLSLIIDHVFFGGSGPCDPCAP